MERKFLEDLELPKEQIDSIMAENGKDIEKAKGDLETITAERDTLTGNLTDVKKQLEEISKKAEGSEEAQKQIETLQGQIAEKEAEHQKVIADKDFNYSINQALLKSGVKNEKAAKALLEIETLKESKNLDSDIATAIASIKESDGYLFGEEDGDSSGSVDTGGTHKDKVNEDALMKGFMEGAGLPKGE